LDFLQALETTVQMLSAQNEQHQKMAQLEVNVWGVIHLN
jgi:hypothetical protein